MRQEKKYGYCNTIFSPHIIHPDKVLVYFTYLQKLTVM